MRRTWWIRLGALALIVSALWSAGATSAFAAPAVKEMGVTNPIGYELKSLQWTHFYATFDQPVWVVLTVHDGTGREVARVFDGAVPTANQRFWFPSWNGKDACGHRLPSSAGYTWKVTAYRGGQSASKNGRIVISRVYFTIKETVPNPAIADRPMTERRYTRYLVDGSANLYLSAGATETVTFQLTMPQTPTATATYAGNIGSWRMVPGEWLNDTRYLRPPTWVIARGIHDIDFESNASLNYQITVLQ